ncbi:receptor binding protein 2 [Campylobacter phage F372]|nr:receptor binding protein 2 [Campylobacter phage F372]
MNLQYPNFTGSKAANLLLCYNGAHTNITGRNVTNCTWSKYELPFATNTVTANGIIHA